MVAEIVSKLKEGSITVEELRVVNEMRDNLFRLCRQVDAFEKTTHLCDVAAPSLRCRNEEEEEYRLQREMVNNFVSMYAIVDLGKSEEVAHLSKVANCDVSKLPICELCKRSKSGEIRVHSLAVPASLKLCLDVLSRVRDSTIFQRLWRRQGEKMRRTRQLTEQPVLLDEIVKTLCTPVFTQWRNVCRNVKEGSITLDEVSDIFSNCFNDRNAIERELQFIHCYHVLSGGNAWTEERATQIEQYGKLENKMDAASALEGLCEVLAISQPMPEIEDILAQVQITERYDRTVTHHCYVEVREIQTTTYHSANRAVAVCLSIPCYCNGTASSLLALIC